VTNCPVGHLTTATLTDYTTWCPGNPTVTSAPTTTGAAKPIKSQTASTVFTTIIHTITACPPSVTNCPAREKTTSLATETKALYTTIVEVETTLQTKPAEATKGLYLETTLQTKPVEVTKVVIPIPVGTGGSKAIGTGGGVALPSQTPFVGGAGRVGGSVFAAAVVGVLALLM
jgi:hypothetical protein